MQLILALGILGLLVVGGGWLLRPTPPARLRGPREGSTVVLRPPRFRNLILAALAIGPTLLVAAIAVAESRKEGIGTAGIVVVSVAIAAGLGVVAYFAIAERRTQVRVDARGVVRVDPFRQRGIAWEDVERIAYNGVSRWFFLVGKDGTRVWVPENWAGIGDLAEDALARIRPAVIDADPVTKDALLQLAAETRDEDVAEGRVRA